MKKILQLVLAATLAFASQAYATPVGVDLSQSVVDKTATLLAGGTAHFDRDIVTTAPLGEGNNFFADRYSFTLNTSYDAIGILTSYLRPDGNGLVITGFNLLNSVGSVISQGALSPIFDANEQGWVFETATPLTSGTYFLEVQGYATFAKGSYSGDLEISPVPEPSSIALMLGGLAVVGFVARRRRA